MATSLKPLSETARVFHNVCQIARDLELLKAHLQALIEKENGTVDAQPVPLVDPRTGRPWRSRRKGGAR